jgi:hypothetical protein
MSSYYFSDFYDAFLCPLYMQLRPFSASLPWWTTSRGLPRWPSPHVTLSIPPRIQYPLTRSASSSAHTSVTTGVSFSHLNHHFTHNKHVCVVLVPPLYVKRRSESKSIVECNQVWLSDIIGGLELLHPPTLSLKFLFSLQGLSIVRSGKTGWRYPSFVDGCPRHLPSLRYDNNNRDRDRLNRYD